MDPNHEHKIERNFRKNVTSMMILFVVAMNYLSGLVHITRGRLWVEVFISVVIPVGMLGAAWWSDQQRHFGGRVFQLCLIESVFNISAVCSLAAYRAGWEYGMWLSGWGFVVFFTFQYMGFAIKQISLKKWQGLLMSTMLITLIIRWFWGVKDVRTKVSEDQKMWIWGEETTPEIKALYFFWATNGLLCDNQQVPKLTTWVVHVASIILSIYSGEFFHIRLLTACHLFWLDGWFGYTHLQTTPMDFSTIPLAHLPWFKKHGRNQLSNLCTLICAVIFAYAIKEDLQSCLSSTGCTIPYHDEL